MPDYRDLLIGDLTTALRLCEDRAAEAESALATQKLILSVALEQLEAEGQRRKKHADQVERLKAELKMARETLRERTET